MKLSLWLAAVVPLIVTTTKPPVVFQKVGELSPDIADYIIAGKLDVTRMLQDLTHIQRMRQWVENALKALPESYKVEIRLLRKQVEMIEQEGQLLFNKAKQLRDLLLQSKSPVQEQEKGERSKRAIFAALGGLALIGASVGNLFYSGYLHSRISELEAEQGKMVHYVDMVSELASENNKRLEALNATLEELARHEYRFEKATRKEIKAARTSRRLMLLLGTCNSAMEHVSRSLGRTQEIWTLALQGHISIELISPEQAKKELERIKSTLKGHMELAVKPENVDEFYKLPCHLLKRKEGFVLAIPIPVYNIRQTYQLYRHIPAPIAVGSDVEMIVDKDEAFLAVNREQTLHLELTGADLQSCLQVKDLYLCPGQRVFRKAADPGCLFLLWKGETEKALENCEHLVRVVGEIDIVALSESEFLTVSNKGGHLARTCADSAGSKIESIQRGTTRVFLPEGCSLSTETQYVLPRHNHTIGEKTITLQTGWQVDLDLGKYLEENYPEWTVDPEEIKDITSRLASKGGRVRVSDVMAARALVHASRNKNIGWYLQTGLGIIGAIIILGALVWIAKRCRGKKGKKEGRVAWRRKDNRAPVEASDILVATKNNTE